MQDLIAQCGRTAFATAEQYASLPAIICNHAMGMAAWWTCPWGIIPPWWKKAYIDTEMLIEYRIRDADSGMTGRSSGDLIAVALSDRPSIKGATSMVYSFFDPALEKRSLGTYHHP